MLLVVLTSFPLFYYCFQAEEFHAHTIYLVKIGFLVCYSFAMRMLAALHSSSLGAAMQHNFRERETLNADPTKTPENVHLAAQNTAQGMAAFKASLPEKRRKDAVLAVEYLITGSPEWFKEATQEAQKEFFKQAVTWLETKYGANNIQVATIQLDETTPHLSAFVTPITKEGKLVAKSFIGSRELLTKDQTSIAEAMRNLGLERGIEGSKAKHQSIRQYYRNLDTQTVRVTAEMVRPQVVEKKLFSTTVEPYEAVAKRLERAVNARLAGLQQLKQENRQLKEQAIRKAAFDKRSKIDLGMDGLALLGEQNIEVFRSKIREAVQQKKLEQEKQRTIEREKSKEKGRGLSR